ncbi:hypothetical protein EGW08_016241 [Elysia chlorotica]|uniref:Uncharacterized protein n=1 Tax=Elysia chlorotica TaxID=188477 RepID=A0A433T388_ELYCH|nr:hypothetical protein EGW08_016241 [Elysia chlorotica]
MASVTVSVCGDKTGQDDGQGKTSLPLQRVLSLPFSDDSGVDLDELQPRKTLLSISDLTGKPDFRTTDRAPVPKFYSHAQGVDSASYYEFGQEARNTSKFCLKKTPSLFNVFQVSENPNFGYSQDAAAEFGCGTPKTKARLQWKRQSKAIRSASVAWLRRHAKAAVKATRLRRKLVTVGEKCTEGPSASSGGSAETWTACREKIHTLFGHFAGETTAHGYKRTLSNTRTSTGK